MNACIGVALGEYLKLELNAYSVYWPIMYFITYMGIKSHSAQHVAWATVGI